MGDGNLSNPNGRVTRLRITCDTQYQKLIKRIIFNIQKLLPQNKVSIIKRAKNFCDISCYSNRWENWLGWKANNGSKYKQNVSIPIWIKKNKKYSKLCLKSLIETDGSIYTDRGYKMVNFVTIIPQLAKDAFELMANLGFKPNIYKISTKNSPRYNIRISKHVNQFIKAVDLSKS